MKYTSLSPAAKELLKGEFPETWHGDDTNLREFLALCAIPPRATATDPIPNILSESDVLRGFKGWKEATSTSPPGQHLGHYQSLIQDATAIAQLFCQVHEFSTV